MTDKEWNLPDTYAEAWGKWNESHPSYRLRESGVVEHLPTATCWAKPVTDDHLKRFTPTHADTPYGRIEMGGPDRDPSVEEWRSVVEHPKHYTWLPVEAIEITERFDFLVGNALKYLIRHQHKGKPLEDLRKARFYIDRAIKNMESK